MQALFPDKRRLILIGLVLFFTIGCDQLTKEMARALLSPLSPWVYGKGLLKLALAHNTGGFLSLGASLPPSLRFILFSTVTGLALLGMLVYIALARQASTLMVVATSLIIGGGLGNLIDRLLFSGAVTDFILLTAGPLQTGVFNVADMAVTLGVVLFLADNWRKPPASPGKN